MAENSSRLSAPEGTVAQSFANDLDSMFGLGMGGESGSGSASGGDAGGIDTLSQTVQAKKQNVSSGQSELEKLEAKLRETEQRLAKVSRQNSPSRQVRQDTQSGALRDRPPQGQGEQQAQAHPLSQKPTYPEDRPPTTEGSLSRPQAGRENTQQLMSGMPGAMPQTPPANQYNGREDYVMVDNGNAR